jgi:hypothetical protein
MSGDLQRRLAALRGRLPAKGPGARGIEHTARNPECARLWLLTLAPIDPATAVREVYGEDPREGQSLFAIQTGLRFERQLFADGAKRLLDAYRVAGRLADGDATVVDMKALAPVDLARRRALTLELLARRLRDAPDAPVLVIHPRLAIPMLGADHDVEPDALIAAPGEPGYRPVEIKSYEDRDGVTDEAAVRGACRQAAVEVWALRAGLARLDVAGPERLAPARADLVLRRPATMLPSLRPMALLGEVDSLRRALDRPRDRLETLLDAVGDGTLDDPCVLDAIPNHYRPSCKEFCPLAAHCKAQAAAAGDPVLLGDRAAEELAPAGSIPRALALRDGSVAPRGPEEAALAARLRAADAALAEAV